MRQQVTNGLNGANWLLERSKRRQQLQIGLIGANWLIEKSKMRQLTLNVLFSSEISQYFLFSNSKIKIQNQLV